MLNAASNTRPAWFPCVFVGVCVCVRQRVSHCESFETSWVRAPIAHRQALALKQMPTDSHTLTLISLRQKHTHIHKTCARAAGGPAEACTMTKKRDASAACGGARTRQSSIRATPCEPSLEDLVPNSNGQYFVSTCVGERQEGGRGGKRIEGHPLTHTIHTQKDTHAHTQDTTLRAQEPTARANTGKGPSTSVTSDMRNSLPALSLLLAGLDLSISLSSAIYTSSSAA